MSKELENKLKKMKVVELRKEISKISKNFRGFSKMRKADLINVMVKNSKLFMHLLKDEVSNEEKLLEKKKQLLEKKKELKSKKEKIKPTKVKPEVAPKSKKFKMSSEDENRLNHKLDYMLDVVIRPRSFTLFYEDLRKLDSKDFIKKNKDKIEKLNKKVLKTGLEEEQTIQMTSRTMDEKPPVQSLKDYVFYHRLYGLEKIKPLKNTSYEAMNKYLEQMDDRLEMFGGSVPAERREEEAKAKKKQELEKKKKEKKKQINKKSEELKIKKPEVKKPEVKKPEVKKPEVKKPEVKKVEPKIKKVNNMQRNEINNKLESFLLYLKSPSTRQYNNLVKSGIKEDMIDRIRGNMKTTDFYPTPRKCIEEASEYIKDASNIIDGACGLGYPLFYMSEINPKAKYEGIEYNDFTSEVAQEIFKNSNINIKKGNFFNIPFNNNYDHYFLNPPFTSGFSKKDNYYIKFLLYLGLLLNNSKNKYITSQLLFPVKYLLESNYKPSDVNTNMLADVIIKTPKTELERYFKQLDFFNKLDIDIEEYKKDYKKELEKGDKFNIKDIYYIILEDVFFGEIIYLSNCKFDTTNFKIANLIFIKNKQ